MPVLAKIGKGRLLLTFEEYMVKVVTCQYMYIHYGYTTDLAAIDYAIYCNGHQVVWQICQWNAFTQLNPIRARLCKVEQNPIHSISD